MGICTTVTGTARTMDVVPMEMDCVCVMTVVVQWQCSGRGDEGRVHVVVTVKEVL